MDDLVAKLISCKQEIVLETSTENLLELEERLKNTKFVFVTFSQTRGGTELGINLDDSLTLLDGADFKQGIGNIRIVGTCELNYHKVKCIGDIDLATRKGNGHLEVISEQ